MISGKRVGEDEFGSMSLTKDAREALLQRIEQMNNTKRDYQEKYKNDIEYNNTLKCLIEKERLNLNKISENIILFKENSKGIQLTNKCLDQNYSEKTQKSHKITTLSQDFKEEVVRMNGLIHTQNNTVENVSNTINKQKLELNKSKEQVKEKNMPHIIFLTQRN